jgi:hypothetical protein
VKLYSASTEEEIKVVSKPAIQMYDTRKIIEALSKPTARRTQQTLLKQTNKHLQQCSVCDPAKMSHIQVYFFPTPPIKLKVGLQTKWETTNSKPPGPIIMIGQSETGSNRHIKFIPLFSGRY